MDRKNRNKLIIFLIMTFLLAWGSWIPAFMYPNLSQLSFIGLFAPTISALIVSGIYDGRKGIFEVLGRYRILNFSVKWYLVAILLMPVIYLLSIFINELLFHYSTKNIFIGSPIYFIIVAFIWLMFINSGEEIGWRGFVLPILLKNSKGTILASFILGLIWGIWHLPMYLIPGQSSFPYPLFLILTICLSFIYTALFIRTKGSLLPAVILHAGTDIGPRIYQQANYTHSVWLTIDIIIVIIAMYFTLRQPKNIDAYLSRIFNN
ncbi:MAG: type II CAAX endopeptidase family protein [Bacillota bacterium]|nr:type II CAAX endopeptidase family protein [Bacillota bacterium]